MATESAPLSIHPELGKEVAVGSIAKELHLLWAEDEARTKASLMNLVVFTEKPEDLVKNSVTVRELAREHACRAILVSLDRAAPEASIRAWITAHCYLSGGRKSVCSEQIAFALTGTAVGRFRNTVFSNLSSDLPLTFWWQGELSSLFSSSLYSSVDRLVFDSHDWSAPQASYQIIMSAVKDAGQTLAIHDLAWTRSFQFRLSLATLFDDSVAISALPNVTDLELVYHPQYRTAALLLLAWVSHQSKWQVATNVVTERSSGAETFTFTSPEGKKVKARMIADEKSPSKLNRLTLLAGETRIEVAYGEGSPHLERRLTSPSRHLALPGPADPDGCVALIGEQLSRGGRNTLFMKVLPRFLELLAR
jgi:glucose-6-phosphate dehydrogenase assembly protein OpcA